MNRAELVQTIVDYCKDESAVILKDIQQARFETGGSFNGNNRGEQWKNNAKDVIKDKGRNEPLVDLGNLKKSLLNVKNWEKEVYLEVGTKSKNKQQFVLKIPETETFTDPKYDKLNYGGYSPAYVSPRGNYMGARELPQREFKNIHPQDVKLIRDKLVEGLQRLANYLGNK